MSATGRRLLLAMAALVVADVIGVFPAASSDLNAGHAVWGFNVTGFVPLPMVAAELALAWLAARDRRPRVGRVAAILLSLICLISVLSGMFDGDMRNESMTSESFWWGVILIVLTATVGLLAVSRSRELRA